MQTPVQVLSWLIVTETGTNVLVGLLDRNLIKQWASVISIPKTVLYALML
jgi:hypothetical protein